MSANPNFRDPAKPAFATLTFKGGGDATAAGRAVMETGEFDYAWNLQLAPEVISKMAAAGKGTPVSAFGTLVERIEINLTDPSPSLPEGERATAKHPHPFLSDLAVRKALSMRVFSLKNNGFSMPEYPVPCPRLDTNTCFAFQHSSTGIPAMGLLGSSCAAGFTMSLDPITIATSVLGKSSLISSISRTMS